MAKIKSTDLERRKDIIENAWLGLDNIDEIKKDLFNPLTNRTRNELDHPGLRELAVMKNPHYLSYAAKVLLGVDLLPEQAAILEELWTRPFPMFVASRGFGKSWLMALYCMLRMVLTPEAKTGGAGVKIVIVGAAFRQSKVIFEYMETLWRNAPVLRDLCDQNSGPRKDVDRCTMRLNENWTIAIPLGDGTKIRGLRATIIIADEFASVPPDIYETVVQGFAAVSADPVKNVKEYAVRAKKKELGIWDDADEEFFQAREGNQIIISGTADYDFKHYADYWKRYCAFVRSDGDVRNLREWFDPEEGIPEHFNYRHYSVIRVPYDLIPKGFMDDRVVTRAKATVHSGIYQMEYGACFTADSDGFFKRSLIESCVTSDNKPVVLPSGPVWFDAVVHGKPDGEYVYGIDPASEADNFSIVVLQICGDHRRVVYCWTTNREDFKKRRRAGLTDVDDFYSFCARKIRDLMRVFPPAQNHPLGAAIGIDAQGGGIAVLEALHDTDKIEAGEHKLWPIIDPDKPADTDIEPGLHLLDMVQFANFEWTSTANHGLRKDMEDKVLLYPRFDTLSLEIAAGEERIRAQNFKEKHGKELTIYDSLEDCVLEIEELKNELTTIVQTRTGTGVNGRDRWDTPEIKLETGKKGRLRKDRYSSLVIANMVGRQIARAPAPIAYEVVGGFASEIKPQNGQMYNGPEWFAEGMQESLDMFGAV